MIYRTEAEKWRAVVNDIAEAQKRGHPCSWAPFPSRKSEKSLRHAARKGIKHVVLNAKYHQMEAEIVAPRPAASVRSRSRRTWPVAAPTSCSAATPITWREKTLAEKAAQAGGHSGGEWEPASPRRLVAAQERVQGRARQESSSWAGLLIVGTERHESRRIDNQLRGRAGRQGDPGARASISRSTTI